jgi:hypothetical protein
MTIQRTISLCLGLLLSGILMAQRPDTRLADKQFDLHAWPTAIQSYLDLYITHPENVYLETRIGQCYFHSSQPEKAVEWLSRGAARPDFDASQNHLLAQALMMTGRYAEAAKAWTSYRNEDPGTADHFLQAVQWAQSQTREDGVWTVRPEVINSNFSEFGIVVKDDAVFFNSFNTRLDNPPTGWVAGEQYNYIYTTGVDANGFLRVPRLLRNQLNYQSNEGPMAFMPDAREVIFMRTTVLNTSRFTPEAGFQSSLFVADVNEQGRWENIRPFPFNGTGYSSAWPTITPDGMTLYFASDRPGGFGGMDIYVCQRRGKDWGPPQNLGGVVNTPGHEITPFLMSGALYFASDWHPGMGGFDLFKAIGERDIYAQVIHLGPGINSPADDLGMVFSRERNGYFVSNRKGKGDTDLYQFQLNKSLRYVHVLDAHTGLPIEEAHVEFPGCNVGPFMTGKGGIAALVFEWGRSCPFIVKHGAYQSLGTSSEPLVAEGLFSTFYLEPAGVPVRFEITDADSGAPLADVKIRATNQTSGKFTDLTSDAAGRADMLTEKGTLYFVNVFKPGYRNASRTFTTPGVDDDAVLRHAFALEPTGQPVPPPASPAAETVHPTEVKGPVYAVQVAAVKNVPDLKLDQYGNLSRFGTVYQRTEGNTVRIRVGLYDDRKRAQELAREIDLLGYKGAFVVEEEASSLMGQVMVSMTRSKPPVGLSSGSYRIRLGAFRNPENFSAGALSSLGTITDEISGEWTIKFLDGFQSLTLAREALLAARQQGFPDAYLLRELDGISERVE